MAKGNPLSDRAADEAALRERLAGRLARIRVKILVLSGKGGVGKSTVAVNLAAALADRGSRVGLLDVDLHGPSIPGLLALDASSVSQRDEMLVPARYGERLAVMSLGFLLPDPDDAVIWRGPLKYGAIRQLVADVEWGDLDFLIVDSPPGTGDEPLSVAQILGRPDGAVIVTTPQRVAVSDVRRCVTFCRKLNLPVVGVVENMSGFACPHCGKVTDVFKTGGGEAMAADMGVPFLARIPLDPAIVDASDRGVPYVEAFRESTSAKAFAGVVEAVLAIGAARR